MCRCWVRASSRQRSPTPTGRFINRRDGDAAMRKVRGSGHGLISAQEIACFAYCPEQCRLEYGLGLLPANTVALEAGTRHYASKALAERIAGGLGVVGGALMSRRCCCSASAARVACGGIAGRQGFEIALSSGDTIPTCWGEFRGNQEEQGEKRHCGFWPSGRHARTHWR